MESIRCHCGAQLFKARADAIVHGLQIKCRRCGALHHVTLRPQSPQSERPERLSKETPSWQATSKE